MPVIPAVANFAVDITAELAYIWSERSPAGEEFPTAVLQVGRLPRWMFVVAIRNCRAGVKRTQCQADILYRTTERTGKSWL